MITGSSTTMEGGYEDDLITVLELVVPLSLQLPVCVVDQDQHAGSSENRDELRATSDKTCNAHCLPIHEEFSPLFEEVVA